MLRLRCLPKQLSSSSVDVCVDILQLRGRRGFSQSWQSRQIASLQMRAADESQSAAVSSLISARCGAAGEELCARVAATMRRARHTQRMTSCCFAIPSATQRRFQSTASSESKESAKDDGAKAAGEEGAGSTKGSEKAADGTEKPPEAEKKGIRYQINALKVDMKEFPDIYNATTLVNFLLFTIFCLCSTGSNVEERWWMDYWGIDGKIMPTGWFLHSLLMNNFMSMAYAMMLVHSMCHAVMPTLGGKNMLLYLAVISVISGVMMQGFNYAMNFHAEKQFGPWDFIAGLFVMQYMHQGVMPWTIVNGFSGWVKYASWVGSVCILYYDYQPVVCGTLVGLILCKTKFKAPAVKA